MRPLRMKALQFIPVRSDGFLRHLAKKNSVLFQMRKKEKAPLCLLCLRKHRLIPKEAGTEVPGCHFASSFLGFQQHLEDVNKPAFPIRWFCEHRISGKINFLWMCGQKTEDPSL